MNVEIVPIKSIQVTNRAREDLGDLSSLVTSIQDKGLLQPLIVDQELVLLAGGRRYEASLRAGLLMVPVHIRRISTPLEALEIELLENIERKEFHWAERAALEKRIFDLRVAQDPSYTQAMHSVEFQQSVGKTNRNLELAAAVEAFPSLKEQPSANDALKVLKRMEEDVVRSRLLEEARGKALTGVKVAESNYKIGDALEGLKALPAGAYHFAEVDPPYAVDIDTVKSRRARAENQVVRSYTEWTADTYVENITAIATELYRVLHEHSYIVWWHGATWYAETRVVLRAAGFRVYDIPAIWHKGGQGENANPDQMLASCYEQFFVARKGDPKLAKVARSNVFQFAPVPALKKVHGTEKPIDLLVEILETFTFPGARIVCPFLGSGVTLRACYKSARIGFGWDLSEEHKRAFLAQVASDELAGGEAPDPAPGGAK